MRILGVLLKDLKDTVTIQQVVNCTCGQRFKEFLLTRIVVRSKEVDGVSVHGENVSCVDRRSILISRARVGRQFQRALFVE